MADDYLKQLLASGEVVLIDTRQHWMAAIRFALRPILLIVLAVVLLIFNQVLDFDGFLNILNEVARIVLVVAAIVAAIWLPIDLIRWRSRHYVLTNRRVLRLEGVLSKNSVDSSLEKINDIESTQSVFGRTFGYTDLVLYTASESANEEYDQLIDGLQFKKAVLDAKEAMRIGHPLEALPEGFVVSGGTNAASRGASTAAPPPAPVAPAPDAATPEVPPAPAPQPPAAPPPAPVAPPAEPAAPPPAPAAPPSAPPDSPAPPAEGDDTKPAG